MKKKNTKFHFHWPWTNAGKSIIKALPHELFEQFNLRSGKMLIFHRPENM